MEPMEFVTDNAGAIASGVGILLYTIIARRVPTKTTLCIFKIIGKVIDAIIPDKGKNGKVHF